jgi:hypothetical protein
MGFVFWGEKNKIILIQCLNHKGTAKVGLRLDTATIQRDLLMARDCLRNTKGVGDFFWDNTLLGHLGGDH